MRKEYDFSKGVRGNFFRKNMHLKMPIYLDQTSKDGIKKYMGLKNGAEKIMDEIHAIRERNYLATKKLSKKEIIKRIRENAEVVERKYGLLNPGHPKNPRQVAEDQASYDTGRRRKKLG